MEKLGFASKNTVSYSFLMGCIKSFNQFIMAAQVLVSEIWLLTNVEIAFDCSSALHLHKVDQYYPLYMEYIDADLLNSLWD